MHQHWVVCWCIDATSAIIWKTSDFFFLSGVSLLPLWKVWELEAVCELIWSRKTPLEEAEGTLEVACTFQFKHFKLFLLKMAHIRTSEMFWVLEGGSEEESHCFYLRHPEEEESHELSNTQRGQNIKIKWFLTENMKAKTCFVPPLLLLLLMKKLHRSFPD